MKPIYCFLFSLMLLACGQNQTPRSLLSEGTAPLAHVPTQSLRWPSAELRWYDEDFSRAFIHSSGTIASIKPCQPSGPAASELCLTVRIYSPSEQHKSIFNLTSGRLQVGASQSPEAELQLSDVAFGKPAYKQSISDLHRSIVWVAHGFGPDDKQYPEMAIVENYLAEVLAQL